MRSESRSSPRSRFIFIRTTQPCLTRIAQATSTAERGAAATLSPMRSGTRSVAAAAVVEPEVYEFRAPRVVAALEAPEPIGIDPMPPGGVDVTPVTVEPLVFERLTIVPIDDSK